MAMTSVNYYLPYDNKRRDVFFSVLVSILAHFLLLPLIFLILEGSDFWKKRLVDIEDEIEEVSVMLPEVIETVTAEKTRKRIVDVDERAAMDDAFEPIENREKLLSYVDTKAMAEVEPDEILDNLALPQQSGDASFAHSFFDSVYTPESTGAIASSFDLEKSREILEDIAKMQDDTSKRDVQKEERKEFQPMEFQPMEFQPLDLGEGELEAELVEQERSEPTLEDLAKVNRRNINAQEASEFSPEQRKSKRKGNILNLSDLSSPSTSKSEAGKYGKLLKDIISKKWYEKHNDNAEHTKWGNLSVRFVIEKNGSISDIKIVIGDAGGIMKAYTLEAILEAPIPPIPEAVVEEIGEEQLVVFYEFMVY